jgi:hypothetical protein
MREKSKLELILARQRQKLDEVKNQISKEISFHLFVFRLIISVQCPVMKVHIRMNLNSFIIEFVNNKINKNDFIYLNIYFFFMCFMFFKKIILFSLSSFRFIRIKKDCSN